MILFVSIHGTGKKNAIAEGTFPFFPHGVFPCTHRRRSSMALGFRVLAPADDLHEIVTLKAISNGLMKRIQHNYRTIVGFNAGLIVLGVGGIIQPTVSALLHNTSTLVISLRSMQNLLEEKAQ